MKVGDLVRHKWFSKHITGVILKKVRCAYRDPKDTYIVQWNCENGIRAIGVNPNDLEVVSGR